MILTSTHHNLKSQFLFIFNSSLTFVGKRRTCRKHEEWGPGLCRTTTNGRETTHIAPASDRFILSKQDKAAFPLRVTTKTPHGSRVGTSASSGSGKSLTFAQRHFPEELLVTNSGTPAARCDHRTVLAERKHVGKSCESPRSSMLVALASRAMGSHAFPNLADRLKRSS